MLNEKTRRQRLAKNMFVYDSPVKVVAQPSSGDARLANADQPDKAAELLDLKERSNGYFSKSYSDHFDNSAAANDEILDDAGIQDHYNDDSAHKLKSAERNLEINFATQ